MNGWYRKRVQAGRSGKVEELLNQMTETGALSREFRAAVNPDKIARFLESDLAARMAGAAVKKKLHKEQPFVLGLLPVC